MQVSREIQRHPIVVSFTYPYRYRRAVCTLYANWHSEIRKHRDVAAIVSEEVETFIRRTHQALCSSRQHLLAEKPVQKTLLALQARIVRYLCRDRRRHTATDLCPNHKKRYLVERNMFKPQESDSAGNRVYAAQNRRCGKSSNKSVSISSKRTVVRNYSSVIQVGKHWITLDPFREQFLVSIHRRLASGTKLQRAPLPGLR
jgi:hypothetical protein